LSLVIRYQSSNNSSQLPSAIRTTSRVSKAAWDVRAEQELVTSPPQALEGGWFVLTVEQGLLAPSTTSLDGVRAAQLLWGELAGDHGTCPAGGWDLGSIPSTQYPTPHGATDI